MKAEKASLRDQISNLIKVKKESGFKKFLQRCGFDQRKGFRSKITDVVQPFKLTGKYREYQINL